MKAGANVRGFEVSRTFRTRSRHHRVYGDAHATVMTLDKICVLQYDTRFASNLTGWWWDSVAINRDWAERNHFEHRAVFSTSPCRGGARSNVWCTISAAIYLLRGDCDVVIKLDSDAYVHPNTTLSRLWDGHSELAISSNGKWGVNRPCAGVWIAHKRSLPLLCRWANSDGPFRRSFRPSRYFKAFPAEQETLWNMVRVPYSIIPDSDFFDRTSGPVTHLCHVCKTKRREITRVRRDWGLLLAPGRVEKVEFTAQRECNARQAPAQPSS